MMQGDKEPDNGINIKFGADRKKGEYRLVGQGQENGKKARMNGTTERQGEWSLFVWEVARAFGAVERSKGYHAGVGVFSFLLLLLCLDEWGVFFLCGYDHQWMLEIDRAILSVRRDCFAS